MSGHNGSPLTFARDLAEEAGADAMRRFHTATVKLKPDGTEVTDADVAVERLMRQRIEARFPDHAILGEELGAPEATDRRPTWVLDPIDGTAWYALGIPKWGVLVGLLEENEPVVGACHLPATGETCWAATGAGCWYRRNGGPEERLRLPATPVPLAEAYVSAAGVDHTDVRPLGGGPRIQLGAVAGRAARFRFVGDCVQHVLVARGRLHAAVDPVMAPWDVAALIPIIREAGGVATTIDGKEQGVVFGGSLVTSCHPGLHEEILRLLTAGGG